MAIRKYKLTSAGVRGMSVLTFDEITKTKPEKSLLVSLSKSGGRNSLGRVTVRHRGGGAKRKYRIIDFKRNKDGIRAPRQAGKHRCQHNRRGCCCSPALCKNFVHEKTFSLS